MAKRGRPVIRKYPQRSILVRLPETVYQWLRSQPKTNRSLVLAALCKTYETCPKGPGDGDAQ